MTSKMLLDIPSDENEAAPDSFCKRYGHSDLLYSRNYQYKILDLYFFENQHIEHVQRQKASENLCNIKLVLTTFKIKNYFLYKDPILDDLKFS